MDAHTAGNQIEAFIKWFSQQATRFEKEMDAHTAGSQFEAFTKWFSQQAIRFEKEMDAHTAGNQIETEITKSLTLGPINDEAKAVVHRFLRGRLMTRAAQVCVSVCVCVCVCMCACVCDCTKWLSCIAS